MGEKTYCTLVWVNGGGSGVVNKESACKEYD